MPTGYTVGIDDDNISFKQFVERCAHAFFVDRHHDNNGDKSIPSKIIPSQYHNRQKRKYTKEFDKLLCMSNEELFQKMCVEHADDIMFAKQRYEEEKEKVRRYEEMKRMVNAWTPPTAEHGNIKAFMQSQLEDGKPNMLDFYKRQTKKKTMKSVSAYRKAKMKRLRDEINYHRDEYKKDADYCKDRTKWLRELKKSIEG